MFIYGESKALQMRTLKLAQGNCSHCDAKKSLELHTYTRYAHIFFIPCAPVNKESIIICTNCDHEYSVDVQNDRVKEIAQSEKKKLRNPVWYFSGIGIIAAIVLTVVILGNIDNQEDAKFVKAPLKGDLYEIELENGWFTSFIIKNVSEDSVVITYNEFSVDQKSGLDEINEKENYRTEAFSISRKELEKMYEDGEVKEIDR